MDPQLENLHSAMKLEDLLARMPRDVEIDGLKQLRNFLIHHVWESSHEVKSEITLSYTKPPKSLRQAMMNQQFCEKLRSYSQLPQARHFEERQLYVYVFIRMLGEAREILYEDRKERERSALLDQRFPYRDCITALKPLCDLDAAKDRNRARNRLVANKRIPIIHKQEVKIILNSDLSEEEINKQLFERLGPAPRGYKTWIEFALAQEQQPEGIGNWGHILHTMNSNLLKFRSDNNPIVQCALVLTIFPDLLQIPQAVLDVCQYEKCALQDTGDLYDKTMTSLNNLIRDIRGFSPRQAGRDFSELNLEDRRRLIVQFFQDPAPASVLELLDGFNSLSITPGEQENGGGSGGGLHGVDGQEGPSTATE